MPDVFDADSLIRSMLSPNRPGKVARHKLAYAVFRLSIVRTGQPLFSTSCCAALPLGPCFIDLLEQPDRQGNPAAFSTGDLDLFREVLEKLGAMSGAALAARSHKNYYEWRVMREGMRENQSKVNGQYREIPVSLIRRLPQIKSQGAYIGAPLL